MASISTKLWRSFCCYGFSRNIFYSSKLQEIHDKIIESLQIPMVDYQRLVITSTLMIGIFFATLFGITKLKKKFRIKF